MVPGYGSSRTIVGKRKRDKALEGGEREERKERGASWVLVIEEREWGWGGERWCCEKEGGIAIVSRKNAPKNYFFFYFFPVDKEESERFIGGNYEQVEDMGSFLMSLPKYYLIQV